MRIQDLIDKIQEIKLDTFPSPYNEKEDLEEILKRVHKICDNILLDWKAENAKCLSLTSSNEKP